MIKPLSESQKSCYDTTFNYVVRESWSRPIDVSKEDLHTCCMFSIYCYLILRHKHIIKTDLEFSQVIAKHLKFYSTLNKVTFHWYVTGLWNGNKPSNNTTTINKKSNFALTHIRVSVSDIIKNCYFSVRID